MLLENSAAEAECKPLPQSTSNGENLQALIERHAAFLGFVQRRVQDRALAEDILQSAYVRALQRASTVRDAGAVVPWFYSVLRNAIIDNARRRRSESGALERWAAELEESREGMDFTHGIVCGCIEKLLPTLKPSYAEILREVDLGEGSLANFALQHNVTAGNAAVRAHRARAALKKELIRTCGVCCYHACLDCSCKASGISENSLK